MEKGRQSRARKKVAVGMAILCRGQGGLPEVMTLQQRPEGSQQASSVDNWGKGIPGSENSQSKGLEAGRRVYSISVMLASFDHSAHPCLPGCSL